MTKISFKEFVSDVKLPLSLDDFNKKCDKVAELLEAGEITSVRASGLKELLRNNVSDDVKKVWASERRSEMISTVKTISSLMDGKAHEQRAVENKALNDFRSRLSAVNARYI